MNNYKEKKNDRPKNTRLLHDICLMIGYLTALAGILLDTPLWLFIYSHLNHRRHHHHHTSYYRNFFQNISGLFSQKDVIIGTALLVFASVLIFIAGQVEPKGKSVYNDEMTQLLAKADNARGMGDVEGELTALRQMSLAGDPPSDVSLRIARITEEKNDYIAALEIYRDIISKDDDCQGAYAGIVRCLVKDGKYAEAFEYAEKSTSLTSPKSPDYAEVMANYALVSAKAGDMQTAEYALQEAELAGWEDVKTIRDAISQ